MHVGNLGVTFYRRPRLGPTALPVEHKQSTCKQACTCPSGSCRGGNRPDPAAPSSSNDQPYHTYAGACACKSILPKPPQANFPTDYSMLMRDGDGPNIDSIDRTASGADAGAGVSAASGSGAGVGARSNEGTLRYPTGLISNRADIQPGRSHGSSRNQWAVATFFVLSHHALGL